MRVVILLLVWAVIIPARADDRAVGRWEGVAQIPGRELTLVIDLARSADGKWDGALTIPGLNVKGAALTDIIVNGVDVSLAAKSALSGPGINGPKVHARFSTDGSLSGDFTFAGNRAPITLRKIGLPDIEPPRRSTAVSRDLEGEWRGSYELFGYPRKVSLKLSNRAENGATAEFVIVGKKENKLPVDLVTQTGDFLTVNSQEAGLTFEGQVLNDVINGTVLQGPLEIPVKLTRAK